MRLLTMPGKMKVLIPSVMALRETAMTAPLDQQGEPLATGISHFGIVIVSTIWLSVSRRSDTAGIPDS